MAVEKVSDEEKHAFQAREICTECGETEDDCDCDDPFFEEIDECVECDGAADEEQHEEDE